MKFHNRAFPYPILDTTDEVRQDFSDGDFQAVMEEAVLEGEEQISLKVAFKCSVTEIVDLIDSGKAAYALLIICPSTLIRRAFVTAEPIQEISLNISDFFGEVELIPQIVVTDKVSGFVSEDLHEEFRDFAFDLRPGDVLAIGDSEIRTFEFEGLRLEHLIKARFSATLDANQYEVVLEESKIYIDMGAKLHRIYGEMKQEPAARPWMFMSIYKDMFLMALQELASEEGAMDKRWASAMSELALATGLPFNPTSSLNEINLIAQKILQGDTVDRLSKQYLGDK
jgi:hypothetical protein